MSTYFLEKSWNNTIGGIIMNNSRDNDDYIYYQVRANIKKYRNIAGLTSQELADKSGFTHQFIRNLESLKAVVRPRLDTLSRIAKALNIDIRSLFDDLK